MSVNESVFDDAWLVEISQCIPRRIREMPEVDVPETDDEVAWLFFNMHEKNDVATQAACGLFAIERKKGKSVFDAYGVVLAKIFESAHR
jgi:hypothetical protein